MQFKKILAVFIVVFVSICCHESFGQLQQERNCEPHKICVFPGDFLKYSHWINTGTNDTVTYNFGNFVGNDKINVDVNIISNGTQTYKRSLLVDLDNGLTNVTRPNGSIINIAVLVPIPVQYNKTRDSYEDTLTFDGVKRKVIVFTLVDQFNSRDKEIDEQTGVVLSIHQTTSGVGSKFFTISGILKLLDTNIISLPKSSSSGSNQESMPSSEAIRANWWQQTGTSLQIFYLVIGLAIGLGLVVLYLVKFRQKQVVA